MASLTPNNEPNRDDSDFDSLRSNVYLCAGHVISKEAFKTLIELTCYPSDAVDGVMRISDGLEAIEPGLYAASLENAANFRNLINGYDEILDNETATEVKATALATFVDELCGFLFEYRKEAMELENISFEERNRLLERTDKIINTLSFYVANDNIPYQTDISEVISAMAPEGKCELSLNGVYTTSVSPHLLRATIRSFAKERDSFLNKLQPKLITRETIFDALEDKDDFTLTCLVDNDELKITQDGYKVTISWSNQFHLGKTIEEKQELFDLSRQKRLFQELGGDVTADIDRDKISVTLHLPHAEPSSENNSVTEIGIPQGAAAIDLSPSRLTFRLPHKDSDPSKCFILSLDSRCLRNMKSRAGLISLLHFSQRLNSENSIGFIATSKINDKCDKSIIQFASKYINGPLDTNGQRSDVIIDDYIIMDQDIADKICDILSSVNCSRFRMSDRDSVAASNKLSALKSLIGKASNFSRGDVTLHLDECVNNNGEYDVNVLIKDSDDRVLVNAFYLPEGSYFVGRCHPVELTDYVLGVLDGIFNYNPKEPEKKSSMKGKISEVDTICDALFGNSICPTESFEQYLKTVYAEYKFYNEHIASSQDPHDLFLSIRRYIERGMVTIEQLDEDMVLDCLSNESDEAFDEFAIGNMIYLDDEE